MARNTKTPFERLIQRASAAGVDKNVMKAVDWYVQKATNLRKVDTTDILKEGRGRSKTVLPPEPAAWGDMYLFQYFPKHADSLEYYDRFPLVIIIGSAKDGFLGLNLHYLDPKYRAVLFKIIATMASNSKFDDSTNLFINYKIIQRNRMLRRLIKPCIKKYLYSHVYAKQLMYIRPNEWPVATFLPTYKFMKAGTRKVWNDSRKQILP